MTMGEGGAVLTSDDVLEKAMTSLRDWGRDCWCPSGVDNTCKRRFEWQLGDLPLGYDHKYVYSHLGYNLKVTDLQASVGVAQLARLDGFVDGAARQLGLLPRAARRPRRPAGAARADARRRPLLVRLHGHGARGRALHAATSWSRRSRRRRSRPACSSPATWCASRP